MFLKRLMIEEDDRLIRDILFRKGINLIVDETSIEDKKISGNNVGKTTTLRLIDYCLGSDGKNIYTDSEFKNKTNSKVECYLREKNIVVTLILKTDFNDDKSKEIKIRRNFLKDKKNTILEIDDNPIEKKDFTKYLKKLFFNSRAEKPTFRQIIAKNIRDDKYRLLNTVKVLYPATKPEEYEALYLFWLGIDLDESARKQKLLAKKSLEKKLQERLKKESSFSQVSQSLILIENSISELEEAKSAFQINEDYEKETKRLNIIKIELNRANTKLSRLMVRKELIEESLNELNSEVAKIDLKKIELFYSEAKSLIPDIQKSFQETLEFHNGMINEKRKFITSELPDILFEINELEININSLLENERYLTKSLVRSGKVEDLQIIIKKLNEAYESKGKLEEQKRVWVKSNKELENIENELIEIDKSIQSLDGRIQERVAEFNKFFSSISNTLYGEKFLLSADKGKKGYELEVSSLFSNPGTGRKKGEVAAFDLSYIQFADACGIPCLHFILQDQIENTHDNQISSLLTEIVENLNCQYVLSVLKDKLPSDVDVDKFEVLKLSQANKLFGI